MKYLLAAAIVAAMAPAANAINLVQNGGFELTTGGAGQINFNTALVDWAVVPSGQSLGYTFIFTPGSADTTGVVGQYETAAYPVLKLWGPNDGGGNNGFPATSPSGGNFVSQDGPFHAGPLEQTITGLAVGNKYTLTFEWAAAQQVANNRGVAYTGVTSDQGWDVSLGGETLDTVGVDLPNKGFGGWYTQTFVYTATATSEVLKFLATGETAGEPPFTLLDGVSLVAGVPEPATWAMMLVGVAGMGAVARRRRSATPAA